MKQFDTAMPSFASFFKACWGDTPFPWQIELANHVADNAPDKGWPSLLDVPTGLGKTAALDVFVWHLASQAHLPASDRTAPTRAAFVIDRRLVVDSAFRRLRALTRTLDQPTDEAAFAVAQRLRAIGGTPYPLVVQRMRGGITWQSQWVRQPDQPAIVCGTVDQIGSRLLSRGYGSSPSRMPIDAGLLGTDCVLIIDEAHLSSALATTIQGVCALESKSHASPLRVRSGRIVKMTATSPTDEPRALRVNTESSDVHHLEAGPRLLAQKQTVLISAKNDDEVTKHLIDLGRVLLSNPGSVVLVVCNTVKRARQVYEELKKGTDWDSQLLIGRCRDLERNAAEPRWFDRARAGRTRSDVERPLLLVSTQTVEVGVDLDVDSLVSEIASADALVQRFGRVDRLGKLQKTVSAVVGCPFKLSDAPVYGESAAATWSMLSGVVQPQSWSLPKKPDFVKIRGDLALGPTFDAGPLAFRELIDSVPDRSSLFAESPPAPVVILPTLDCWARTSPIPDPDEAVGPYLHGIERINPVVSLAWRAGDTIEALQDSLATTPIRSDELVEIPLASFRNFVFGSGKSAGGDVLSDLEARSSNESVDVIDEAKVVGLLVRSRAEVVSELVAVRPGDIVVLQSSAGGHDDAGWTGMPGAFVADIADVVERSLVRLRLNGAVLQSFGVKIAKLTASLRAFERLPEASDATEVIKEFLQQLSKELEEPTSLAATVLANDVKLLAAAESWTIGSSISYDRPTLVVKNTGSEDDENFLQGVLLSMKREQTKDDDRLSIAFASDADDDGESGEGSSLLPAVVPGVDLSLLRHSTDVGSRAKTVAQNLGLPIKLVSTLAFAGFLHDLGKAEVRFQAMLRRGDRTAAETAAEFALMLAKSDIAMSDTDAQQFALRQSRWPGLRHEAISLALARGWPSENIPVGVDADLALYLVATHHGYGRPWFPADREDRNPTSIAIEIDSAMLPDFVKASSGLPIELAAQSDDGVMAFDQPDRCKRLRSSYGFWGLSFLEAILRLADMAVSEELGVQLSRVGR